MLAAELPFPLAECVWRFEDAPGGAVLAHVARRADLEARLAALRALGCDPAALVPPGPALWRADCASRPLPPDAPRAVFFAGPDRALLAAGRGDALSSVAVFASSDRAAPALRLRLAFGGLPDGLAPLVAGPGAAALATALPATLAPVVPQSPEAHLARALAAAPLAGLDLRAEADPHPAAERPPRRLLAAASLAVLLSAALAAAAAWHGRAAADAALRDAQRDRAARLSLVAGYAVRSRGDAAIAEAREAAAARRDPALFAPDASAAVPAAIEAARAAGVRLAHLALEDGALSASGTAPDASAAESFAAVARAAGLRASIGEDPKPAPSGGVAFYVRPAP